NPASGAESALLPGPTRECLHAASSQTTFPARPTTAALHPPCRCAPAHWPAPSTADNASSSGSAAPYRRTPQNRGLRHTAPRSDQENKFATPPSPEFARARRVPPLV